MGITGSGVEFSIYKYKIYIDMGLRSWSQKCHTIGLPINQDYHLYNLLFADDQMIIAQDTEDAEYML
jgi:hypothetical protein